MKLMKRISLAAVLGALAVTASAQVVVQYTTTPNQSINYLSGNSDTITVPSSSFTPGYTVGDVNVFLNLAGNTIMYNSDFIAYLAHDFRLAYLIHNVGAPTTAGYGGNGMNVKFDDAQGAIRDIHSYATQITAGQDNPLTGTWSSDGRLISTDARSLNPNPLATFNGTNPSGDWRLYVQDALSGAQSSATLVNWGVEITAVPEPSEYAMVFGLALIGFAAYRRYTVKTA